MRRIAAALLLLSLAGCDDGADGADEPPVVIEAHESGLACEAGWQFLDDDVTPWMGRDPDSARTADRGCTYLYSFALAELSEEVADHIAGACLNVGADCDESLRLEESVLWTESACEACDGQPGDCLDLLDPTGRC